MMNKVSGLFILPFIFLCGLSAHADDTPDKSQYTLFNPVPDNLMRSFSTDRPTKSDSPYTVDAGHFQYETDIANWTYDHYNTSYTTSSNLLLMNTVAKLGLTQNTDFEIAFAPLNFTDIKNRPANTSTSANGIGDIYTRLKFNVLGNEGGNYALALVPYVKAPSASSQIGNRHWEGGGYIPFVAALPNDWTLTLLTEVDVLENAALDGTHANYQNLVNFSHPMGKDATGYAEIWNDKNTDRGAKDQWTADFAAAWMVRDNLQLDAGINVGLNEAAPDLQPYFGISQRF